MIHPACSLCQGACCELLGVPVFLGRASDEDRRFLETRGTLVDGQLLINSRCTHLHGDGRCVIYDDRPEACREFVVGSEECRQAIQLRRPIYGDDILKRLDDDAKNP